MIAVSDTGPLNYLILTELQDVLREVYEQVIVPHEVSAELRHPKAPDLVRRWMRHPPEWLEIIGMGNQVTRSGFLHMGEAAALEQAQKQRESCVFLVDDWPAKEEAVAKGIHTSGTVGFLFDAALSGLLDFEEALTRLSRTNLACPTNCATTILKGGAHCRRIAGDDLCSR